MKKWTIQILRAVGLVHDPDNAPPHPWNTSKPKRGSAKVEVPGNIVYNAGTPFVHETTQHGFEEVRWNGRPVGGMDKTKDTRTPEWYAERGLDPQKYEVILHCRNMGMTQQETSNHLQERFRTGFKIRTIQKYWPSLPPIGESVA